MAPCYQPWKKCQEVGSEGNICLSSVNRGSKRPEFLTLLRKKSSSAVKFQNLVELFIFAIHGIIVSFQLHSRIAEMEN